MKVCKTLFLVFVLCFGSLAQDDDPVFYKLIKPKHSYAIDFALPVPIANKAFKGIMQGLVRFSASYQFALKNNISLGLGGNYSYFFINRFKISPQLTGGMQLTNVYVKLAYEKYSSERIGFDGGLKFGYASLLFNSNALEKANQVSAPLVEPYAAFCLTASEQTAYKWMLSYTFMGFGFTPERIGDYVNQDYALTEYHRVTRFLSFGFSYSHYFKQW